MARTTLEDKLRKRIKAGQALYGLSNPDMATKMHLSLQQWERRLKKPGKLSYDELVRLEKVLKMDIFQKEVVG